jgi:hypothetical protein
LKTAEWFGNMSIVHEMLVRGFSLPFYKLLQGMPMCGVFLITRDFHITIKEDKSLYVFHAVCFISLSDLKSD